MGETYKKRQKALARREKQQKKAARRMERRVERSKTDNKPQTVSPEAAHIASTTDSND